MNIEEADYNGLQRGEILVSEDERWLIAKALTYLPDDLVYDIGDDVQFISSAFGDCDAWIIDINTLIESKPPRKYIILLCDKVKDMKEKESIKTILHEIAHYHLKHPPHSVSYEAEVKGGNKQTIEELQKIEDEADALATKWMKGDKE